MGLFDNVAFWVADENERAVQTARALERDADRFGSSGPAPSSGFSLDRGQAENMLERAIQIRRELRKLQNQSYRLDQITPPARDQASLAYHEKLLRRADGEAAALAYGGGHVNVEVAYLDELIRRLKTALGLTLNEDEQAADTATKAGQPAGGYAG